jgi:hypothetical protein
MQVLQAFRAIQADGPAFGPFKRSGDPAEELHRRPGTA